MSQERRLVFTDACTARWEEFTPPEDLGPSEVRLRTLFSAVSVGTETAVYTKSHVGFRDPHATYPRYPFHPGYAATAEVEAVGPAVRDLEPGQLVCFPGPHSSCAIWDLHRQPWAPIPAGLSPRWAAFARLGAISINGVRLARVQLGDSVCVLGAGLIGQFAAQLARLDGARPIVIGDPLARRLAAASACGVHEGVNPAGRDARALRRTLADDRGFDVVIEASGAPPAVGQALALVADYGRVVLLGSPRGAVEIDPYTLIHRPGVTIIGAHVRTAPPEASVFSRWTPRANLELVLRLLAAGELVVEPLISHQIPADAAPGIYERLVRQPDEFLGVVVDWRRHA